jgi:hypothetical protein
VQLVKLRDQEEGEGSGLIFRVVKHSILGQKNLVGGAKMNQLERKVIKKALHDQRSDGLNVFVRVGIFSIYT